MSDYQFIVDFNLKFEQLTKGLTEIDKKVGQTSAKLKKEISGAFEQAGLQSQLTSGSFGSFVEKITAINKQLQTMAKEGTASPKVLSAAFTELNKVANSSLNAFKISPQIKSDYKSLLNDLKAANKDLSMAPSNANFFSQAEKSLNSLSAKTDQLVDKLTGEIDLKIATPDFSGIKSEFNKTKKELKDDSDKLWKEFLDNKLLDDNSKVVSRLKKAGRLDQDRADYLSFQKKYNWDEDIAKKGGKQKNSFWDGFDDVPITNRLKWLKDRQKAFDDADKAMQKSIDKSLKEQKSKLIQQEKDFEEFYNKTNKWPRLFNELAPKTPAGTRDSITKLDTILAKDKEANAKQAAILEKGLLAKRAELAEKAKSDKAAEEKLFLMDHKEFRSYVKNTGLGEAYYSTLKNNPDTNPREALAELKELEAALKKADAEQKARGAHQLATLRTRKKEEAKIRREEEAERKRIEKAEEDAAKKREKEELARQRRIGNSASREFNFQDLFNFLAFSQLTSAVKSFAQQMVEASSVMEQYKRRLDIVTKDTNKSDKLFGFLKKYERNTPYGLQEVMQSGIQFQTQKKAVNRMGDSVEEIVEFAGELAAINPDAGMQSATAALTRIIAGDPNGLEIMRSQFGISNEVLKERGVTVGATGVSMQGTNQKKAVYDAIKQFTYETTGGRGAAGQSDTLMGKLSILESQAFTTLADVIEPLVPAMKTFVDHLAKMLELISNLPDWVKAGMSTAVLGTGFVSTMAVGAAGANWARGIFSKTMLPKQASRGVGGLQLLSTMSDVAEIADLFPRGNYGSSKRSRPASKNPLAKTLGGFDSKLVQMAPALDAASGGMTKFLGSLGRFLAINAPLIGTVTAITLGVYAFAEGLASMGEKAEEAKKAEERRTMARDYLNNRDPKFKNQPEGPEFEKLKNSGNMTQEERDQALKDFQIANDKKSRMGQMIERSIQSYQDYSETFFDGNKDLIDAAKKKVQANLKETEGNLNALIPALGEDNSTVKDLKKVQARQKAQLRQLEGLDRSSEFEKRRKAEENELNYRQFRGAWGADHAVNKFYSEEAAAKKRQLNAEEAAYREAVKKGEGSTYDKSKLTQYQEEYYDLSMKAENARRSMEESQANTFILMAQQKEALGKLTAQEEQRLLYQQASTLDGGIEANRIKQEQLRNQAMAIATKEEEMQTNRTINLMKYKYGEEHKALKQLEHEKNLSLRRYADTEATLSKEGAKKVKDVRIAIEHEYQMQKKAIAMQALQEIINIERENARIVAGIRNQETTQKLSNVSTTRDMLKNEMNRAPARDKSGFLSQITELNKKEEAEFKNQLDNQIKEITTSYNEKINDLNRKLSESAGSARIDVAQRSQYREQVKLLAKQRDSEVNALEQTYKRESALRKQQQDFENKDIKNESSKATLGEQAEFLRYQKARLEALAEEQKLSSRPNKNAYLDNLRQQFEMEKAALGLDFQQIKDDPSVSKEKKLQAQKQLQLDINKLQNEYLMKAKEVSGELETQNRIKELEERIAQRNKDNPNGIYSSYEAITQAGQDEAELFRLKHEQKTGSSSRYSGVSNKYSGLSTYNSFDPDRALRNRFGMQTFDELDPYRNQTRTVKDMFNEINPSNINHKFKGDSVKMTDPSLWSPPTIPVEGEITIIHKDGSGNTLKTEKKFFKDNYTNKNVNIPSNKKGI